jgi:Ni/Fe-hydrogenase subunit HybB-like protein
VGEIMVTVGVVSLEIMLYLWFVKRLPVLPVPREVSQASAA